MFSSNHGKDRRQRCRSRSNSRCSGRKSYRKRDNSRERLRDRRHRRRRSRSREGTRRRREERRRGTSSSSSSSGSSSDSRRIQRNSRRDRDRETAFSRKIIGSRSELSKVRTFNKQMTCSLALFFTLFLLCARHKKLLNPWIPLRLDWKPLTRHLLSWPTLLNQVGCSLGRICVTDLQLF